MTAEKMRTFITKKMRMSQIYQPVMLQKLLSGVGTATEREIAKEILQYDESQIEYFQRIVQNMVGRVLRKHSLVERDRKTKTWTLHGFDDLSSTEIKELQSLLEDKKSDFLKQRGDSIWSHRKKSSGYISGTIRYEILKQAKFRCELCGVSAEQRALEVDHILPRNKGGSDEQFNLQALCYSCNAMKRDRDDTDFRPIRASYEERADDCIFCHIDPDRHILEENELAYSIRDGYPVTKHHTLVVVKRHSQSLFDLSRPEINACLYLLDSARKRIAEDDESVTDFNIGINDGAAAGQTIPHCHIHLIPRRAGDHPHPRGGVRQIIPGMGDY
jgi:ATP adenylyltransferase